MILQEVQEKQECLEPASVCGTRFTCPNFIKFTPKFLFTSEMSTKDERLLQTVPDKPERLVFRISSSLGERRVGFCSR